MRVRSFAKKAGLVGVAAAAALAVAPAAHADDNRTAVGGDRPVAQSESGSSVAGKWPARIYPFASAGKAQCEEAAALIRDGSTGAWCELWQDPYGTVFWGLFTTDT